MDAYFPCTFIAPDFSQELGDPGGMRLLPRRWGTSIFDLAELAVAKCNRVTIPYQLMDVFLHACNVEIVVPHVDSLNDGFEEARLLRTLLLFGGVAPFTMPVGTSESVNDYSGIKQRKNAEGKIGPGSGRTDLLDGRTPFEAAAFELSPSVLGERARVLGADTAATAIGYLPTWKAIRSASGPARVFEDALNEALQMRKPSQSLLQIWTGLEALFPTVTTEVSFKVALYLAMLQPDRRERRRILEASKKAYRIRSSIAHGAGNEVSPDQWRATWEIAIATGQAILTRRHLPTEAELVDEIIPNVADKDTV